MCHFMKTLILPVFLMVLFQSCSTPDKKGNQTKKSIPDTLDQPQKDEPRGKVSDTLIIDKKAAVFFQPDSIQIEKREKEIGEENFYIGADDYLFYMHTANDFLDSLKFPILEIKDKKYLWFINADKSQTIIKLDTLPELWGIYLFDPSKRPKLVDMTIIDEEYKSYYK